MLLLILSIIVISIISIIIDNIFSKNSVTLEQKIIKQGGIVNTYENAINYLKKNYKNTKLVLITEIRVILNSKDDKNETTITVDIQVNDNDLWVIIYIKNKQNITTKYDQQFTSKDGSYAIINYIRNKLIIHCIEPYSNIKNNLVKEQNNEEINPLYWLQANTKFLNHKHKNNYLYYYLYNYYPRNKYSKLDIIDEMNRDLIWEFKDGFSSILVAKLIASSIINETTIKHLINNETLFVTIPASTKEKNDKRFKIFSEQITDYLQITNGYDNIKVLQNRESLKGTKGSDKTNNLRININNIAGKNIIIFDDIITTGDSFTQIAKKLETGNPNTIIGVFLGRTTK